MKIGYQGVPGAYSEVATINFFGENGYESVGYDNFRTLIKDLSNNIIDYAVLPIENSTTGIIYRTMDLIRHNNIFAIGEVFVPIHHQLIGFPDSTFEDITDVYSHPEALSQCNYFFEYNEQLNPISWKDTSESVGYIKRNNLKNSAALASKRAAEIYEMKVLRDNVQDIFHNTTRFLIFQNKIQVPENANKTTMYFQVQHTSGALLSALQCFANEGLNLINLNSRPLGNENIFQYGFFIEIDESLKTEAMQRAIEAMKPHVTITNIIGSYQKGELPI